MCVGSGWNLPFHDVKKSLWPAQPTSGLEQHKTMQCFAKDNRYRVHLLDIFQTQQKLSDQGLQLITAPRAMFEVPRELSDEGVLFQTRTYSSKRPHTINNHTHWHFNNTRPCSHTDLTSPPSLPHPFMLCIGVYLKEKEPSLFNHGLLLTEKFKDSSRASLRARIYDRQSVIFVSQSFLLLSLKDKGWSHGQDP